MVFTSKIIVEVFPSWNRWPFTSSHRGRAWGSGTSSLVTIQGPIGANVSQLFPLVHCPPGRSIWNSRSETSLTTQ